MMELDLWSSTFLVGWLAATVRLAGPLLLAALGELFAERAGVLNIGIEGLMLLGALASYLASWYTGEPWLGLSAGVLAGIIAGSFLAWMYVTVGASQVVVGIIFKCNNVLVKTLYEFPAFFQKNLHQLFMLPHRSLLRIKSKSASSGQLSYNSN